MTLKQLSLVFTVFQCLNVNIKKNYFNPRQLFSFLVLKYYWMHQIFSIRKSKGKLILIFQIFCIVIFWTWYENIRYDYLILYNTLLTKCCGNMRKKSKSDILRYAETEFSTRLITLIFWNFLCMWPTFLISDSWLEEFLSQWIITAE